MSGKSIPILILNQYRPIPLRRLTDIYANPELITREEAELIRDNDIARREIIRIGLSPTQILSRFGLEEEDILFE